jgi:hypothetical protein
MVDLTKMNRKEKNNRRSFFKSILITATAFGLLPRTKTTPRQAPEEKIKMLTADGKLVEINKSVLDKKAGLKRASDKEVFNWMNRKHKT